MYFDEDIVLDIRLNTLKDKVDKFIIVEATKNHAGQNKKLNFKIENFTKFKSKIVGEIPIDALSTKAPIYDRKWIKKKITESKFNLKALKKVK